MALRGILHLKVLLRLTGEEQGELPCGPALLAEALDDREPGDREVLALA